MSLDVVKVDVDILKDMKVDKVVKNLKLMKGKELMFGMLSKICFLSIVFVI